jgi:hypothetical protein
MHAGGQAAVETGFFGSRMIKMENDNFAGFSHFRRNHPVCVTVS